MGHARIAIENEDATVRSVYLHADGGLGYAGLRLLAGYSSVESAEELIGLGDLVDLEASTDNSTFFGRDKGESVEYTRPVTHSDLAEFLGSEEVSDVSYIYVFFEDGDFSILLDDSGHPTDGHGEIPKNCRFHELGHLFAPEVAEAAREGFGPVPS